MAASAQKEVQICRESLSRDLTEVSEGLLQLDLKYVSDTLALCLMVRTETGHDVHFEKQVSMIFECKITQNS